MRNALPVLPDAAGTPRTKSDAAREGRRAVTDKLLSAEETAGLLGMSRSRFYQVKRELGIPEYKISGLLKYRESEIWTWVQSRRTV
jgi:predicted DNA-binding transcriptional regulator AlpA